MSRSFSGRLFLSFLLFANIPTLVMAVVGYYFIRDAGRPRSGTDLRTMQDATRYHTNLLFERLSREATAFQSSQDKPLTVSDMAVTFSGDSLRVEKSRDTLSESEWRDMILAARSHRQGFVELGARYAQFVAVPTANGDTLVVALLHAPEFGRVIAALEGERQLDYSRRTLWPGYLTFLGCILLVLTGATVAVASIMSRRTSRRIARPLEELGDAARRIASGEFRQSDIVSHEREIQALIESFNLMARQLDSMTARLAQSERVAAWRQIAQRFAHELKNPLQPILVSLYRIEQQTAGSDLQGAILEPLRAASEEVKHLQQLAERFSQLSKLPPVSLKEIDLVPLIRSAAELHREQLGSYRFEVCLPDGVYPAMVDEGFLREAVHNLLQNAADASTEGGSIELRLASTESQYEITVKDSGTGMDAKTLATSRLPYFTTKIKGSGLGLAIVERSMTEMGGQLTIESVPGHGTIVKLIVPR